MSATAVIIYQGFLSNPARFRSHYEQVHVPLLWNLDGLRRVELDWDDAGEIRLVTHLIFDSLDRLKASLNGPARAELRVDMEQNLVPHFHGTVLRAEAERIVFEPPERS